MAGLHEFIAYLDNRTAVLGDVEDKLCTLQRKYEVYFGEISRVREREFRQLTDHVKADRAELPEWFNRKVDEAAAIVTKEYEKQVEAIAAKHGKLTKQAEDTRTRSSKTERTARKRNEALDREEEALKARNEQLLLTIQRYNEDIRSLGSGFGFFANFFRLRALAKERAELDEQQADVAARIDRLRAQWASDDEKLTEREREFQHRWVELETEAAALRTKLDYLRSARERIVMRSTLERVLYELGKDPAQPAEGDPECPRCKMANPDSNHFCHVCAKRLSDDRPDFEGSVHEIAELNRHYQRFAEGMKACQEIIGLVRGLRSGLNAFKKSVLDVQNSESQHDLPTLQIDVPALSVSYGRNFDVLAGSLRHDWTLHPKVLADRAKKLVSEVLTEKNIKGYFETMGEELSRQANSQW